MAGDARTGSACPRSDEYCSAEMSFEIDGREFSNERRRSRVRPSKSDALSETGMRFGGYLPPTAAAAMASVGGDGFYRDCRPVGGLAGAGGNAFFNDAVALLKICSCFLNRSANRCRKGLLRAPAVSGAASYPCASRRMWL
jgi:hypothetical protein